MPVKIVHIGACSLSFGCGALSDIVNTPELKGSTLFLVDIDEEHLKLQYGLALRMNEAKGAGLDIRMTTDRREALPGADFVLTSVATKRNDLWKLDWEIPLKHGLHQVLGENGGPGGLSHTLRNVPLLLSIARDMEELCPDALLFNFTNPESRLILAINRYTRIKAYGMCHGVFMGQDLIAETLGMSKEDVGVSAAGLNHFLWILDARDRRNGEDLYPAFKEKFLQRQDYPLTRHVMGIYGKLCAPSDDHIGEYLAEAWDFCPHHGYDFAGADSWYGNHWSKMQGYADGSGDISWHNDHKSGEVAYDIIAAIVSGKPLVSLAVSVPNNGCITNLPKDCCVEVPVLADGSGIHPLCMGDLPLGIAALCTGYASVQNLAVEAAARGDRELALQALLSDPVTRGNVAGAKATLEEFLKVHAPYLPQFA